MKTFNQVEKAVFKSKHPKKKVKYWEVWTKFGTPVCIDVNINKGILIAKYRGSVTYRGIY